MPYTIEEKNANYRGMFGLDVAQMDELKADVRRWNFAELDGEAVALIKGAASILSDAQHVMDPEFGGDVEQARQMINRAKSLMFDAVDELRSSGYGAGLDPMGDHHGRNE